MTKQDETARAAEDLIDLGAASVETKGGDQQPVLDAGTQKFAPIGLSAD